jgi:hypothetical protein
VPANKKDAKVATSSVKIWFLPKGEGFINFEDKKSLN